MYSMPYSGGCSYSNSYSSKSIDNICYGRISNMNTLSQQTGFSNIHNIEPETITIYKDNTKTYEEDVYYKPHSTIHKENNYELNTRNLEIEHMIFTPKTFLDPNRPETNFITKDDNIEELVKTTFEKLTGEKLPNLKVRILNKPEFMVEHSRFGSAWSEGIMGFAVHATNEIFIREAPLDELMVVIGHEIGHLMSTRLPNIVDEEAKAMAFERAWCETIMKHNIGNLKNNIRVPEKAHNGVHNIADSLVDKLMNLESAINAFERLAKREIKHSFEHGMVFT